MTGLAVAGAAVAGAWAILIGAAIACRRLRLGKPTTAGIVLACYAGLSSCAIEVLGRGWQGVAGAGGMLLPGAVALALALV